MDTRKPRKPPSNGGPQKRPGRTTAPPRTQCAAVARRGGSAAVAARHLDHGGHRRDLRRPRRGILCGEFVLRV